LVSLRASKSKGQIIVADLRRSSREWPDSV
jgi:hypothetical protein